MSAKMGVDPEEMIEKFMRDFPLGAADHGYMVPEGRK
jgi:hypothetical protein